MSLPSRAIFYTDDLKEIYRAFVNCGWICDRNTITRVLEELEKANAFPEEWGYIDLYGFRFSNDEVQKILDIGKLWRNKIKERENER